MNLTVRSISLALSIAVLPISANALRAQPKADPVVPTFANLRPASSVIGWDVRRGDKLVGSIADLLFDLETSQVALLVIAQRDESDTVRYLALPTVILEPVERSGRVKSWVTDEMVASARQVAKTTDTITRGWAADEYKRFGRDPYWKEFRDQLRKENPKRTFDEVDHRLDLYSKLCKEDVVDIKGKSVGRIVDFGIEPDSSQVVYVALQPADKQKSLNAIPLGAFVIEHGTWLIELDREAITARAKFESWNWPTSTSRAWIEYVAVRYGRTGVQSERKAK